MQVKPLMKAGDMSAGKTLMYLWEYIMWLCVTLVIEYEKNMNATVQGFQLTFVKIQLHKIPALIMQIGN